MPLGNVSKKDLSKMIRKFKNYLIKVMRGGDPNMSLLTVILPSKTACEVYDES